MIGSFDKTNYKKLTKSFTQKEIAEALTDRYGIDTKIDTVKSWTRKEDRNNPTFERLNALADMCKCSIQDFFSDADQKREQIAYEELSKKPEKYSNSALSSFLKTIPNGDNVKALLDGFLNLTEQQQNEVLNSVKEMALENLKF